MNYILALIITGFFLICMQWGPLIPGILVSLLLILTLFISRLDIAFYIVLVLWMTLFSVPLGIASPFTAGETADLPLYEAFTPLLCLCLLIRIAMRNERISNSPLKMPMLIWFSLIILTYFRNPIFLSDLFGEGRTGTIYHILYKFLLCAAFYLFGASILKTERRIFTTAKIMCAVMIAGLLVMTLMVVTGWDIPIMRTSFPMWSIRTTIQEGGTVFRIASMSSYSTYLLLAILCFGSNLGRSVQIILSLLLLCTLVLGGGRTETIVCIIYFLISFIIQRNNRWLIGTLSALSVILISMAVLLNTKLPYTTQRIVDFSSQSTTGIGGRLAMAEMSLEPIMKRPFIGYGYGQLWKYFPHLSEYVAGGLPHSGFLAVMTAQGLIGLGIFLWVIFIATKTAWMLYNNMEDGFIKQLMLWITLHLISSLVVFFISAQIETSIITYLEIGVISAAYAIFDKQQLLSDSAHSMQSSFV